ncbi:MAG: type secretory system conjugative transfer family protein [Acidimicrobiaceae bacterium]|nr:type secretory system conjugative transfer family protein [Acidimicrobiaceae bacterium]
MAWPSSARHQLPSAPWWYASLALVWAVAAGAISLVLRLARPARGTRGSARARRHRGEAAGGAAWAGPAEVARLAVRRPGGGRLVLGRCGRRLVALESGQSVLVVGPTQSGKTSGLAIPALLEWEGPVLATSVKTDLVRDTFEARQFLGSVHVFDPTGVSGRTSAGWSPLAAASSWEGARKVAAGLCGVARTSGSGVDDAAFWYATAEKLLAPLLFAAATSGGTIADVVRWVDTGEVEEVLLALELAGVPEAARAAEASFSREERQRSSVYTTAETVLSAYADPAVAATCARHDLDPAALLDGGRHSVYLVAPSHEQERLQSVFVAIVRSVVEEALTRSSRQGRPLDPPLLLVLDEAANVAPLTGLDTLAATASSHGIQLVTVWQDLAQVEARYGSRAATVVNNHRAKVLCSGITDPTTLEQASRLIGDEEHTVDSSTVDASGGWSRTRSVAQRRLAPVERLRCLQPGEAVLLYGHLPPLQLALRPFYERRSRTRRAGPARGHAGRRLTSRAVALVLGRASRPDDLSSGRST